ncbi:hypothetical protein HWV62_1220 [Athelia sp. TMB]|nr:hypothetical protein HWV62_1220 [Athelia sp. TMB]
MRFQWLVKKKPLDRENMSIFSVEIFEMIVDALHYCHPPPYRTLPAPVVVPENSILMVCALVCRHWLKRSRALQFKSIDLTYASDYRLSAFARLLQSPVATLAPHVQHISLELRFFHLGHRARTKLARLASLAGIEALKLDVDMEPPAVEVSVAGIKPFLQSLRRYAKASIMCT